ncbi:hypothetical protein [Aliamphritea spongicola]
MYKELDISNWNRKEHFEFFKEFEEPFMVSRLKLIAPMLISTASSTIFHFSSFTSIGHYVLQMP